MGQLVVHNYIYTRLQYDSSETSKSSLTILKLFDKL